MLESIKRRVSREGLKNVVTRLGTDTDANLPKGTLDAVLVVDVYQEVEAADTASGFLRHLADALKTNGRIGIVNYKPGAGGPGPSRSGASIAPSSKRKFRPPASASLDRTRCRSSTCWLSAGKAYNSRMAADTTTLLNVVAPASRTAAGSAQSAPSPCCSSPS